MRRERDPDLLLIEQMLAPPPLEDALRSLEFWQQRRRSLQLHRRTARREAREMIARCRERVRAAEQARFDSSFVGRLLAGLGISSPGLQRARLAGQVLSWVAWVFVMRKAKLVVRGLALSAIVVVAAVTTLILVLAQLA